MEKLDWRVHRFFESCAHGYATRIRFDYGEFQDIMTQFEEREFIFKTPMCLKKLTNKTNPKPRDFDDSDSEAASRKPQGKIRRLLYTEDQEERHVKFETHK